MVHPLIIAALLLAGVAVLGLVVDVRAAVNESTRTLGFLAITIKLVLMTALLYQMSRLNAAGTDMYDSYHEFVTFFALVAAGVPLVGVTIACEVTALSRLSRPPVNTHHVDHAAHPVMETQEIGQIGG